MIDSKVPACEIGVHMTGRGPPDFHGDFVNKQENGHF